MRVYPAAIVRSFGQWDVYVQGISIYVGASTLGCDRLFYLFEVY